MQSIKFKESELDFFEEYLQNLWKQRYPRVEWQRDGRRITKRWLTMVVEEEC
jgi:hypothetical protein